MPMVSQLLSLRALTPSRWPSVNVGPSVTICRPSFCVCPAPLALVGPCQWFFGSSPTVTEVTLIQLSAQEEKQI